MAIIFMTDPATGRVALFDENGTSGDPKDPNSVRNAPLNDPAGHLDKTYFNSDLDYMEVSHGPTDVVVPHPTIGAGSGPGGEVTVNQTIAFGATAATHTLLTHGLGYVPDFFVIADDNIVYPGQPIQYISGGRTRRIAPVADATNISLKEWAIQTDSAISGFSKTYTVVVFKRPPAASGTYLLDFDPTVPLLQMGLGKFRTDRRYLQVVPGGSPYGFSKGRTIDLKNGAIRYVDPDGSVTEPIPASLAMKVRMSDEPNDAAYGASMGYNGSFAGSGAVLVQVP